MSANMTASAAPLSRMTQEDPTPRTLDTATETSAHCDPSGEQPASNALAMFLGLTRAPADAPSAVHAWRGLTRGLQELARWLPGVSSLGDALAAISPTVLTGLTAPATPPVALRGRTKQNYVWAVAIRLGAADASEDLRRLAALYAAELLRAQLAGKAPSRTLCARLSSSIANPGGRVASNWPDARRIRDLEQLAAKVRALVSRHPQVAHALGLTVPNHAPVTSRSAVASFNALLRARMANAVEFARVQARLGISGHGAADPVSLASVGRSLRGIAEAGDSGALRDVLCVITGYTPRLVDALPLTQVADSEGVRPDAWLDLDHGCLWSRVAVGMRDRTRPPPGAEDAHLPVTDSVQIPLPAWWTAQVRARRKADPGTAVALGTLLDGQGSGRRRVDGGAMPAYGLSVARLRAELTSVLLDAGAVRYTLAIALHAPALVAVGRLQYGAIHQQSIDHMLAGIYATIGWGSLGPATARVERTDGGWVGAQIVPRDDVLRAIAVAQQAAVDAELGDTTPGLLRRHNLVAAAVAYRLALCLALRKRVAYPIRREELRADTVYVVDKAVDHGPGVGVPVVSELRHTLQAWDRWLDSLERRLATTGEAAASWALCQVKLWRSDPQALAIWTIDPAGRIAPAGAHTWHAGLLRQTTIAANAGRHWWATVLTDQGEPQVLLDALLRHEATGLAPGAIHSPWPAGLVRDRLAAAMATALARLQLPPLEVR